MPLVSFVGLPAISRAIDFCDGASPARAFAKPQGETVDSENCENEPKPLSLRLERTSYETRRNEPKPLK
jgi:hypothetical protein